MSEETKIRFEYIKSPLFRTIHMDGMIGGMTPQGYLHFAIYNERPAIPKVTEHVVQSDGTLSRETHEGRGCFVREMDCDVLLNRNVAVALHEWLGVQIKQLDNLLTQQTSATIKK